MRDASDSITTERVFTVQDVELIVTEARDVPAYTVEEIVEVLDGGHLLTQRAVLRVE